MRFVATEEQRGFARTLDALLTNADTPAVARAWVRGDAGPGLELWRRLADTGVNALLVPEPSGGLGASPVELVVAFEALGRHAAPGPWVESAAFLACVPDLADAVSSGEVLTVAAPPHVPRALDADVAARTFVATSSTLHRAEVGRPRDSVDPARRLFDVAPGSAAGDVPDAAFEHASLACAAQLLGLGEHLLEESVEHARRRRQFGRAIGSYQAVKHALADVRVGLDFARPLVQGAAVSTQPRSVSAARVAAGDASWRAARVALQVHGAVGYTAEHDLSLSILKVRALVGAWGTPAWHRDRILTSLVQGA